jgi:predicted nucleic acid-binding Zn ribbon protein
MMCNNCGKELTNKDEWFCSINCEEDFQLKR